MILVVLAYLAGVLTISSPCILPVLPFVFARAQSRSLQHILLLLMGICFSFSLVSVFALAAGSFIAQVNGLGRGAAMFFLALFGLSMVFPALARRWTEPLSKLAEKLPPSDFLYGVSTGLLWAPCAGPILGLVLTGAAAQESRIAGFAMLLAYSLGAATSLALALLIGKAALGRWKKALVYDGHIKKVLGVAVLLSVFSMAMRWDRTILTRIAKVETEQLETKLMSLLLPPAPKDDAMMMQGDAMMMSSVKPSAKQASKPDLIGANGWINSEALDLNALKGKVVLVDFWTYSCINCLRTLPYLKAWHEKYKDKGLVIVGVHTPEFAFEHDRANVEEAVEDFGLSYPIAIDNDYKIWSSFKNRYWPAHYFIDRNGVIRDQHFGEGNYEQSEAIIRKLLAENGAEGLDGEPVKVEAAGKGVSAPAQSATLRSHETYLGYQRTENLQSVPAPLADQRANYAGDKDLGLNQWALDGWWTFGPESVRLEQDSGRIRMRFQARDLHLVLGTATVEGVAFRVKINGKAPGKIHGADIDADGNGRIGSHRLYQLIRQDGEMIEAQEFEIEFLDHGAEAFAFTFG